MGWVSTRRFLPGSSLAGRRYQKARIGGVRRPFSGLRFLFVNGYRIVFLERPICVPESSIRSENESQTGGSIWKVRCASGLTVIFANLHHFLVYLLQNLAHMQRGASTRQPNVFFVSGTRFLNERGEVLSGDTFKSGVLVQKNLPCIGKNYLQVHSKV